LKRHQSLPEQRSVSTSRAFLLSTRTATTLPTRRLTVPPSILTATLRARYPVESNTAYKRTSTDPITRLPITAPQWCDLLDSSLPQHHPRAKISDRRPPASLISIYTCSSRVPQRAKVPRDISFSIKHNRPAIQPPPKWANDWAPSALST